MPRCLTIWTSIWMRMQTMMTMTMMGAISGEYDHNDADDGDRDEVSHMDVESKKLGVVVVVVKGPGRDMLRRPESPKTKTKMSVPMIPIVPQIPQLSSENSMPTPTRQIPGLVLASPIDGLPRLSPSNINTITSDILSSNASSPKPLSAFNLKRKCSPCRVLHPFHRSMGLSSLNFLARLWDARHRLIARG